MPHDTLQGNDCRARRRLMFVLLLTICNKVTKNSAAFLSPRSMNRKGPFRSIICVDSARIAPLYHFTSSRRRPLLTPLHSKKKPRDRNDDKNEDENAKTTSNNNNNNNNNNNSASQPTDSLPLLSLIDPYRAGKRLRQTLNSAISDLNLPLLNPKKTERSTTYYLDDRFLENAPLYAERSPLFFDASTAPEVLVVGATTSVGRLVVKRLLRGDSGGRNGGGFRVRVLVGDLYSRTLNLLGTGVTYCQGDLDDVESLEYAVTDVDKIVFCAGA
eukprot:CAMPEP_0172486578 /NCGR_PEP_ID=MMETSP1066-20121228/15200_1 /TAXON_ID=671091 /ORGANISM="Coscinodiscus wailesii, Strain CCMP2513" /LENGTH=271 /DNA_ID=CAMNT_0013252615 /DNA_START=197 /DNA_END=1009 /DNA_ORIENTATION=+